MSKFTAEAPWTPTPLSLDLVTSPTLAPNSAYIRTSGHPGHATTARDTDTSHRTARKSHQPVQNAAKPIEPWNVQPDVPNAHPADQRTTKPTTRNAPSESNMKMPPSTKNPRLSLLTTSRTNDGHGDYATTFSQTKSRTSNAHNKPADPT